MSIQALGQFPANFVAGDQVIVNGIGSVDYPPSAWNMSAVFNGRDGTSVTVGASPDADGITFDLTVDQRAKLSSGRYSLFYVFTSKADPKQRASLFQGDVFVLDDPATSQSQSVARQTLDAMQNALLKLSNGTNTSVNFNGQTFTKRNLKDLQDAIDRQKNVVNGEEVDAGFPDRYGAKRIGVRFA